MNGFHDLSEPKLQNFFELLASDLEQSFVIPPYQRHFIWDRKRIEFLFRDLFPEQFWKNAHDPLLSKQRLFLGCVVLCKRAPEAPAPEAPTEVIDGQQRLTILSMSLMELLSRLEAPGGKDMALPENIVAIQQVLRAGPQDIPLHERVPRLTLQSKDADVWSAICSSKPLTKYADGESKSLVDAHRCVKEEIAKQLVKAGKEDISEMDALMTIVKRILRLTSLIRFETKDMVQAFILFETLNYRGVPLNAADLTKNKTLALAQHYGEPFFNEVHDIWEDMTHTLGRDNLEVFLHHYWIGHHEITGKLKLFEKVSEHVSPLKKPELLKFLKELQSLAHYYKELMHPVLPKGATMATEERVNRLLRIATLKAQTCRIVLLYARSHCPDEETNLLELVEAITMRGLTESIQPRDIDKAYKDACAHCRDKNNKTNSIVKALKEKIKPYAEKVDFKKNFEDLEFVHNSDRVRVILARLNEIHAGGSEVDFYSAKKVDIEHILSRKAKPKARKEAGLTDPKKFLSNVYRIGNLTLWYKVDNRSSQHGPYSEKRDDYKDSKFDLTEHVGNEYKTWNASKISAHSKYLAELADTAWPLNL